MRKSAIDAADQPAARGVRLGIDRGGEVAPAALDAAQEPAHRLHLATGDDPRVERIAAQSVDRGVAALQGGGDALLDAELSRGPDRRLAREAVLALVPPRPVEEAVEDLSASSRSTLPLPAATTSAMQF